ncbi:protoheme IX farnesyltransferase [Halovivax asiaticus JCM 14624]|uniref:Protoheme IX farnesyltransferase n=1 Tax=Halovivax asiaticus JCM 14624 TaxID=1227490 RepID=M0BTC6_9EURY|nr:heme o synthase [Halovivax asiaticus]ELZ13643.1 protoheme IX farnesyltransferase [Halovivax asiaticus JCM 14624]
MTSARFPSPIESTSRFTGLLTATALGVYLLILVGATTSITEAAASCSTWPGCGQPVDPITETELAIALGHRIAALVVAGLVLVSTAVAWLGDSSRRVRYTLSLGLVLYGVQIAVGAVTATMGPDAIVPGLHLALGVVVFGAVVLALAWDLELATGTAESIDRSVATTPAEPVVDAAETAGRSLPESRLGRVRLLAKAYLSMTKPRLMWLLCLVAAAGMALAAGPALDAGTVVATLAGGVLAIGASGTFNHVLERDVDRRMNRTSDRPLALDLVPVRNAILFGFLLAGASLSVFLTVNVLAAALGLLAIAFYSVVYTLVLKPNTVQNTVIGGFAGALPALIGWAAVTNEIGVPALALAGLIFLWTPAHFYNLALAYRDDYERGGFPMLSVVRGETVTRKHIVYYLGATLVGAAGLAWVTDLGAIYAGAVAVFGAIFLWAAVELHFTQTERAAMRTFHASNAFLGAVLVSILVDAMLVL